MIAPAKHYEWPTNIAGYDPGRDADAYWYDGEAAEEAVQFFPDVLVHLDGEKAGEPFHLEDWQKDITRTIYGWKRKSDQSRRYRTIFWFVPRKNGKTTIAAGISLKNLYGDNERRAQCYCCAENSDQARVLYEMVRDQVLNNDELAAISKVRNYHGRIIYRDRFLKSLSASDAGGHGLNVHSVVYDEFHLFVKNKHIELHQSLHTATASRSQPMELIITTAGWDQESLCYKEYQRSCQVRDGLISIPTHLPIIFEAGEKDDWTDEAVWRKANPNLETTVNLDYLREECEKAKRDVTLENVFRRLHLNQWTSQATRWLQMERWKDCPISDAPFDPSRPVFGGLDLSSNVDVTAWVMVQRADDGDGWRVRGHYFIPRDRMKQAEARDRVPYVAWERAGRVTVTEDDSIDYRVVRKRIMDDCRELNVAHIGFDKWNANETRVILEEAGVSMIEVPQTFGGLSSASKEFERCVISRKLDHGRDPVLRWMADNVMVETDANGNIKPVKPKHGSWGKRIDGIVAAVMAIGVGMITDPGGPSIYEEAGNLSL